MSEDRNVGLVSKKLQQKRFNAKHRHTKNVSKFEAEMWNTGDYQFFALWKEYFSVQNPSGHISERRYSYNRIRMTFFGYNYTFGTSEREKHLSSIVSSPINLGPKIVPALKDFLIQKPAGETFVIPHFRGSYHLSFAKRSMFGPTELKWIFLHDKQEWLDAFQLPRGEKKRVIKAMKLEEKRQRLWFVKEQSNKLVAYLDSVAHEYATLPAHAFA